VAVVQGNLSIPAEGIFCQIKFFLLRVAYTVVPEIFSMRGDELGKDLRAEGASPDDTLVGIAVIGIDIRFPSPSFQIGFIPGVEEIIGDLIVLGRGDRDLALDVIIGGGEGIVGRIQDFGSLFKKAFSKEMMPLP